MTLQQLYRTPKQKNNVDYMHNQMYINNITELKNGCYVILYANGVKSDELPGDTKVKICRGKC